MVVGEAAGGGAGGGEGEVVIDGEEAGGESMSDACGG